MDTQTVGYKAKSFEGRNLAWYFLIVLGIPWLAMAPFLLRIVKFPAKLGPGLTIVMAIIQFLPLIVAFLLTGLGEGKGGMKALWKRFWNRDLSIKWLLVVLLLNPAIRLVASLIDRAVSGESYPILIQDFLPAFLFGIIIGIQEEFGWRGYVLPRFQARWNALTSSLILGVIWAFYHAGNWLIPPDNPVRQGDFGWFALWILCLSIFSTWIFNNTRGSVLAIVLYHAATTNGLINCCSGTWAWQLIVGVTIVVAVLVVILFGSKTLVRQKHEEAVGPKKVQVMGG
jgi:membrane protease YdiL (CAAX protease family)